MIEVCLVMLGALIGAVGTGFVTIYVNDRQRKAEGECITQAIVAEISAHLEILKKRHFPDGLKDIIARLQNNERERLTYYVVISRDHSPVYSRNTDKLGLLDKSIRLDVVMFYQLLESVICDIQKNEGYLAVEGGYLSDYKELLGIVENAKEVGERIVSRYSKHGS